MGIIVENPSFETGNFSNWNVIGSASVETADFNVTPTEGTQQAMVDTNAGSVSDTDLEVFLGLGAGDLDNLGNGDATEGSAIQQTVTVEAGDILTFDWNFLTDEFTPDSTFNDFSFVSLTPDPTSTLADTNETFVLSDTPFFEETGFQTFSYEFQSSGTFTVGAGVVDVADDFVSSALVLDNFITINVENGTAANDVITGSSNRDLISGLGGNDVIRGRGGNDTINGGRGNDTLFGDSGDDSILGGRENDRLFGDGGKDTLQGERGNDRLFGGGGNDDLLGGLGNDRLFGQGGDDSLEGNAGNDQLSGGSWNDILRGGSGNDQLSGDSGNDGLFGGSGNDQLTGGSGEDELTGGTGRDTLTGGQGADMLTGGQGNDVLLGNGGADTFIFGADLLDGVADTDTVQSFQSEDILDFSAYLEAGGSIDSTRVASNLLRLDLSSEDIVNVFGNSNALDTAESQL